MEGDSRERCRKVREQATKRWKERATNGVFYGSILSMVFKVIS